MRNKQQQISVVIPALNEAENIAQVVQLAKQSAGVCEVLVIDDGSIDDTRHCAQRAGARVVTSSLLGKGASMEDGLRESAGDVLVYLDGDLRGLAGDLVDRLIAPIADGQADFVKARFSRSAGRVTTLTAKPLLEVFFPELAHFAQPLGGIIAAKRETLSQLEFETDYGVDLALLIDAHFIAQARIAEVDIGHLEHDSQTLEALGRMASQVVSALMHRAEVYGRLNPAQLQNVQEARRHSEAAFSVVMTKLGKAAKLALFDVDELLLRSRILLDLGRKAGRLDQILHCLEAPVEHTAHRARKIASCLAGLSRKDIIDATRAMPLEDAAAQRVVALRKQGYCVGIVSDLFDVIAETLRRRVFADFSVGNQLQFQEGKAVGEVAIAPAFLHGESHASKWNLLRHVEERLQLPAPRVLAIGA